jgi:hypothetical protein
VSPLITHVAANSLISCSVFSLLVEELCSVCDGIVVKRCIFVVFENIYF